MTTEGNGFGDANEQPERDETTTEILAETLDLFQRDTRDMTPAYLNERLQQILDGHRSDLPDESSNDLDAKDQQASTVPFSCHEESIEDLMQRAEPTIDLSGAFPPIDKWRYARVLVDAANREADETTADARHRADEIIADSRRNAQDLMADVRRMAEQARRLLADAQRKATEADAIVADAQRKAADIEETVRAKTTEMISDAEARVAEFLSQAQRKVDELLNRARRNTDSPLRASSGVYSVEDSSWVEATASGPVMISWSQPSRLVSLNHLVLADSCNHIEQRSELHERISSSPAEMTQWTPASRMFVDFISRHSGHSSLRPGLESAVSTLIDSDSTHDEHGQFFVVGYTRHSDITLHLSTDLVIEMEPERSTHKGDEAEAEDHQENKNALTCATETTR